MLSSLFARVKLSRAHYVVIGVSALLIITAIIVSLFIKDTPPPPAAQTPPAGTLTLTRADAVFSVEPLSAACTSPTSCTFSGNPTPVAITPGVLAIKTLNNVPLQGASLLVADPGAFAPVFITGNKIDFSTAPPGVYRVSLADGQSHAWQVNLEVLPG